MVLDGIRVLDAGSFVAGPAAATVMGDFGAEVVFRPGPWAEWRARLDAEGITFGGVAKLDDLARRPPDARDRRARAPRRIPTPGAALTDQ